MRILQIQKMIVLAYLCVWWWQGVCSALLTAYLWQCRHVGSVTLTTVSTPLTHTPDPNLTPLPVRRHSSLSGRDTQLATTHLRRTSPLKRWSTGDSTCLTCQVRLNVDRSGRLSVASTRDQPHRPYIQDLSRGVGSYPLTVGLPTPRHLQRRDQPHSRRVAAPSQPHGRYAAPRASRAPLWRMEGETWKEARVGGSAEPSGLAPLIWWPAPRRPASRQKARQQSRVELIRCTAIYDTS